MVRSYFCLNIISSVLISGFMSNLHVKLAVDLKMEWPNSSHIKKMPASTSIKMVCSHCILIPQGSTGSKIFVCVCQMKAHIFLIMTPKFQLQIHYTLEVIAENVPISGIPIFIFLCIFIIALASPPVSNTYFCPRRENKK